MLRSHTLVVALLLSAIADAQNRIGPLASKIDAIVAKGMRDWEVPGCAIGIVENERIAYLKGFGVKELGRPDPVSPRTVFALASVSKAFCAATAGLMVDAEKMNWNDPVRKHLPGFRLRDPMADQTATIRDLFNHMSGAARMDSLWYRTSFSQQDLLQKVPLLPTALPIRTRPLYNNLMYTMAGLAVDAWQGGKWAEVAKGTSIGICRLVRLKAPVRASRIRLRIAKSPVCVALSEFGLFRLNAKSSDCPIFRVGLVRVSSRQCLFSLHGAPAGQGTSASLPPR